MTQRLFTPRSAREALARLRPAAERMCRLYGVMRRKRPRRIVTDQPVDPAYFLLLKRLRAEIDAIHGSGAQVKDLKRGLLDFPARRDGRSVLLCWGVGESSLEYWREPGADPDGRRRVDDNGPWEEA